MKVHEKGKVWEWMVESLYDRLCFYSTDEVDAGDLIKVDGRYVRLVCEVPSLPIEEDKWKWFTVDYPSPTEVAVLYLLDEL